MEVNLKLNEVSVKKQNLNEIVVKKPKAPALNGDMPKPVEESVKVRIDETSK